jgi:hypothetical protein
VRAKDAIDRGDLIALVPEQRDQPPAAHRIRLNDERPLRLRRRGRN